MHSNGKIFPGESFTVPASVWNGFCDAADDFRNRQNGQHADATGAAENSVVYIQNDTSADIKPHQGVMLTSLAKYPAQGANTAPRGKFLFVAAKSAENGTGIPAVALDRIRKNTCGRAAIAGVALARITGSGNYAKLGAGNFAAADSGFARIIWADSGTAERLALIHFQPAVSSSSSTAEQRPIWIVKILSGTPTTGYSCTVINDLGYTDTSALGMTFFPVLTYSSGATLPANTVCLAVASKTAATASQSTPPAEPEE